LSNALSEFDHEARCAASERPDPPLEATGRDLPGLHVPRRRPKKRLAAARERSQAPCGEPNQVWSYDFVFDHCANGQQLKCLTVTDEFTKEGLAIEVDGRIRSARVIEVLSGRHPVTEQHFKTD
jgi:hypothetical protein